MEDKYDKDLSKLIDAIGDAMAKISATPKEETENQRLDRELNSLES